MSKKEEILWTEKCWCQKIKDWDCYTSSFGLMMREHHTKLGHLKPQVIRDTL